jgi:hypothetical protein
MLPINLSKKELMIGKDSWDIKIDAKYGVELDGTDTHFLLPPY